MRVPLLNFEGSPGVPLLNFREVSGLTFKLWGGSRVLRSRGPGLTFTPCSNQEMKFRQLIEYNMSNIFLEKPYTKCDGETISRPFSKKSKLNISLDQSSKVLYNLFYCMPGWRLSTYIETTCRPFAFTSYRAFLINKKRPGISLSALFCAWFLKKIASVVLLY